jgi:hypothetical protein
VTLAGRQIPITALQWFGLFGAPAAWAAQHIFGILLTLAQCNPSGQTWHLPLHALTIASTATAASIATLGVASALATVRGIDRDADEPPPARIRFLGVIGLSISPLLLCIILMSGAGVVFHPTCQQS